MGSDSFDDLTCVVAVSPSADIVTTYSSRWEALAALREQCSGTWTLYTGDVTIQPWTAESAAIEAEMIGRLTPPTSGPDTQPVNNRGFLDRQVQALLLTTSVVMAAFAGYALGSGHDHLGYFLAAEFAVGLGVGGPVTHRVRQRFAGNAGPARAAFATAGGTGSVPLQPYGWTKATMAVTWLLPLATIGFILTVPA